ncbi:MAG: D-glycero-beta-D-manno-heptose 1,7-bisphosphate 7-phosphatase [Pseudomonadales bacterium]|nr:D-glycero-beta-D-manno-heptose 1,7-bisphosphate 7-phosphatase [Pseudomonadales bacterium]
MEPSKTIVLDRDGVINQDSADYIKSHKEWSPLPGSVDAIASLHNAGYKVIVATNQSGLGRGYFDEYALANIHHKLCSMVEDGGGLVSGIFFCPHLPDDNCECRKPNTGMLVQAEQEFGLSLTGCVFVGDSRKDLQAALAFDMRPVLVRTGNGAKTEQEIGDTEFAQVPVYDDLFSAVQELLTKEN